MKTQFTISSYFFISIFILAFSNSSIAIGGGGSVSGDGPAIKLFVENEEGYPIFCTGTIIHPNVLITASHCIHKNTVTQTYTYRDQNNIEREQKYMEGEVEALIYGSTDGLNSICHHADYGPECSRTATYKFVKFAQTSTIDTENDFAILYRERPFYNNPEIAGLSGYNQQGVEYRVFGGGGTLRDPGDPAIRTYLDTIDRSYEHYFLSDVNDERLCEGDSGGPATFQVAGDSRYYVVGIFVNFGFPVLFDKHCSGGDAKHRFYRINLQSIQWINYVLYYKLNFDRCHVDRRWRSDGSVFSWLCV